MTEPMTDIEIIELAIRRVAAESICPMSFWLTKIADEIAQLSLRRRKKQPEVEKTP